MLHGQMLHGQKKKNLFNLHQEIKNVGTRLVAAYVATHSKVAILPCVGSKASAGTSPSRTDGH
jgi:hypothetical protein